MRITITDMRRLGHCPSGIREWFAAYDLDFKDFVKNGIEAEDLAATGDALALQVIERAKHG